MTKEISMYVRYGASLSARRSGNGFESARARSHAPYPASLATAGALGCNEISVFPYYGVMSQKYPFNLNVPLSPHPPFGHPLPIRWREGRVRGAAVSSLVAVMVKKR